MNLRIGGPTKFDFNKYNFQNSNGGHENQTKVNVCKDEQHCQMSKYLKWLEHDQHLQSGVHKAETGRPNK